MIRIICNTKRNEYDIRPLIMAFFPGEEVTYEIEVCTSDTVSFSYDIRLLLDDESFAITIYGAANEDYTYRECIEAGASDKEYRDNLKRFVYRAMSAATGKELEWGTLTGVRPSKIPMSYLKDGVSKEEIVANLKSEYYMSENKAELALTVASNELEILERIGYESGYSVYIGIPFCPTVCNYCSFSSISLASIKDGERLMEDYLLALKKECRAVRDMMPGKRLTSIYVGGGTPTALNAKGLKMLMDMIRENFDVDNAYEFTVEAGRPDSIDEDKLRILYEAGVTRISVNPQTMKEATLQRMGRKHTAKEVKDAYRLAKNTGFDNINMDLIAGLMGESLEDFENTLNEIMKLGPESFTVHSLVVKRASRYRNECESDKPEPDTGADVSSMLNLAESLAKENGYVPYYMYRQKNKAGLGASTVLENVGYSKKGKEGIYNIIIMEEKQTILALGAGASTKLLFGDRIERVANVKNVREYIDRIDEMIERKKRGLNDE